MQNKSKDSPEALPGGTEQPDSSSTPIEQTGTLARWMQSLLHMGLGELLLRAATNIFSLLAIVIVIWLTQMYFRQPAARAQASGASTDPTVMPEVPPAADSLPTFRDP